eukprot:4182446-Amphidinium_carterae.3
MHCKSPGLTIRRPHKCNCVKRPAPARPVVQDSPTQVWLFHLCELPRSALAQRLPQPYSLFARCPQNLKSKFLGHLRPVGRAGH